VSVYVHVWGACTLHYVHLCVWQVICWLAVGLLSILIVASRKHYTVDVVIAWYAVPLVFWTLHRRWTTKRTHSEWAHRAAEPEPELVEISVEGGPPSGQGSGGAAELNGQVYRPALSFHKIVAGFSFWSFSTPLSSALGCFVWSLAGNSGCFYMVFCTERSCPDDCLQGKSDVSHGFVHGVKPVLHGHLQAIKWRTEPAEGRAVSWPPLTNGFTNGYMHSHEVPHSPSYENSFSSGSGGEGPGGTNRQNTVSTARSRSTQLAGISETEKCALCRGTRKILV
jgi:hypothetical protein